MNIIIYPFRQILVPQGILTSVFQSPFHPALQKHTWNQYISNLDRGAILEGETELSTFNFCSKAVFVPKMSSEP